MSEKEVEIREAEPVKPVRRKKKKKKKENKIKLKEQLTCYFNN
tara:strand:- start:67 stop:195 length:129 start_codon:yes stop_codon:yes gene_type:complete